MGYAPPPPAVPQEQKKAPLQSVYRLWKNPGSATPQQGEPGPVSQTGFSGRDQDSAAAGPVTEAAPPSMQPTRPVPPPLPPRANSTQALHTNPDISRPNDGRESPSQSLASAALQSIVSKDKAKRASLTPPTSTPSSPGQDTGSEEQPGQPFSLDRNGADMTDSPASLTPTPSSPPSPPPTIPPIGRGPPPALPPRRQRTAT